MEKKALIDERMLANVIAEHSFKRRTELYITNADWGTVETDCFIGLYILEQAKTDKEGAVMMTEAAMGLMMEQSLALSEKGGFDLLIYKDAKEILRDYIMPGIRGSISGAYAIYIEQAKINHETDGPDLY